MTTTSSLMRKLFLFLLLVVNAIFYAQPTPSTIIDRHQALTHADAFFEKSTQIPSKSIALKLRGTIQTETHKAKSRSDKVKLWKTETDLCKLLYSGVEYNKVQSIQTQQYEETKTQKIRLKQTRDVISKEKNIITNITISSTPLKFWRNKRQHKSDNNNVISYDMLVGLATFPMPSHPPLSPSNQFLITPFRQAAETRERKLTGGLNAFAHVGTPLTIRGMVNCGGVLKARHGIIQTPNFPHKFQTPLDCVWVIDTSDLAVDTALVGSNISIVVYLTQLYVLSGLKFTEYMYYSDDYKVPAHRVFTLTEDDVTQVAWVQFNSQYLEVRFSMSSLDGTHLRALDRLLDVYGFNITYEVQTHVKDYQCNTLQCRFLGHCFATANYSSYFCDCFPGFSGVDCGRGPLCEDPQTNICQNGGICKHIGDAAISCHCPVGYKGTKCEIPEINQQTMGCTNNASKTDCHLECAFNSSFNGLLMTNSSRISARSGKTRYEVTIRLGANLTAYYRQTDERRPGDHLPSLLERHLMRVLRNFNITKVNDLELISNSTDRLDITFHFFGIKGDSQRIREAITRMVERGRIGNITLVSNYHHFDENPPLNLIELFVNQKTHIRENSELIISCTAQGSVHMHFQWYKDGAIVNASKAMREIWTTVLPPETKHTFTAILGITKANRMDEGIYTCKVIDWGVEQCRSLHVHIKTPPRLRVDPASVTLHRGDSLRVRCLSPGNDDIKRYAQLGYSWTRNGGLFQSDPATVMWEDLYPDGSILKINNIQKSAEYSCMVSNTVRPVSKSVYITVIDRNAVHVCHADTLYGVHWPTSAPGAAIMSDCPRGYEGHARRICEQHDAGNSTWLLPDFTQCVSDRLLRIHNEFRALSAGFQQTNSSAVLKACFHYTTERYKQFLPGEASFLIDMLNEVDTYLQIKGTQLEREMAAEIILHILDKIMQNAESLNSQQQIKKLQLLTQSAALNRETIAASQLATSTSTISMSAIGSATSSVASSFLSPSSSLSTSIQADHMNVGLAGAATTMAATTTMNNKLTTAKLLKSTEDDTLSSSDSGSILTVIEDLLSLDRLNSLRIYMTSVKTLPFNLRIYGDDLFSDQLYMDIGLSSSLLNIMTNATIFASVISYKNLKSFLPKTYYTRGSDSKDNDYVLASRIIQTWLFQSNRSNDNLREPLDLPFEVGHVEIIFQHESVPRGTDWIAVCGHDYKATFESTWRSDLCITKNLMDNITHCICPLSGTYVVMLTKRNQQSSLPHIMQQPIFIIISCAGCLLQCCSAFIVLLPIWYNRKCAITFLKMQFCISTSSIMIILLLGFLKMLPVHWHAIISSSLASMFLLSVSTLLAIALVIHSELVPKKLMYINSNNGVHRSDPSSVLIGIKKQCHVEKSDRFDSVNGITNITQYNQSNVNLRHCVTTPTKTLGNNGRIAVSDLYLPAGVRGAIGISWLLPLLYAIAAPLICSIIGEWPKNWWLQIIPNNSHNFATVTTLTNGIVDSFNVDIGSGTALDNGYIIQRVQQPQTSPMLMTSDSLFSDEGTKVNTTTIATESSSSSISSISSSSTLLSSSAVTPILNSTSVAHSNSITSNMGAITLATTSKRAIDITTTKTLNMKTVKADVLSNLSVDDNYSSNNGSNHYYQQQQQQQYQQQHHLYQQYQHQTVSTTNRTTASLMPSFNFIIFICIDLLFILLFAVLFIILLRKLLWLWHKNRNVHAHSMDKFNLAMRRRIGLLYRIGLLLLVKLCTDAFFIVYVNSALDSLWSYPFGISSILLGFATLFCFVIKSECNLHTSAGGNSNFNSTAMFKPKEHQQHQLHHTTKASLNDNQCTASINSPLNFYTMHEKDKECNSGDTLTNIPIDLRDGVSVPLTVISATPSHCQLQERPRGDEGEIVETYQLGAPMGSLDEKVDLRHVTTVTNAPPITSQLAYLQDAHGTRYCNHIVSNDESGHTGSGCNDIGDSIGVTLPKAVPITDYYDAYTHDLTVTGVNLNTKFVGVDTLDIIQGVTPDSIIDICTSGNLLPVTNTKLLKPLSKQQQYQSHVVDSATRTITNTNNASSITTQTPKSQKRVTIIEPTTHTFDPLLPTMIAAVSSAGQTTHLLPMPTPTPMPIITITCSSIDESADNNMCIFNNNQKGIIPTTTTTTPSTATTPTSTNSADDENSINGMLDRITHDLDYLLNRTNQVPVISTISPSLSTPTPTVSNSMPASPSTITRITASAAALITTSLMNGINSNDMNLPPITTVPFTHDYTTTITTTTTTATTSTTIT